MFRTFVEKSNLAIFKVTLDGKINYINDYFVKTLGYTSEDEILHTSAFDYIHPDSIETVKKAWQKKVDSEEIHGQKIRVIKKNGDFLDVELKAALLTDAEKRPISFFCIAMEVPAWER
jgi:two-component system sporulation sensor kinase A